MLVGSLVGWLVCSHSYDHEYFRSLAKLNKGIHLLCKRLEVFMIS